MESKGEENIEASESFIPCIKIAFGHWEGMAKMESSIHVWEGEGHKAFLFFVGLSNKKVVSFPY